MKKNIGILGFGYWGNIIHNSLKGNDNYSIKYVIGREGKISRLNDVDKIDNCTYSTEYTDLLNSDNIDLVIITTQTKYHYKYIKEFLINGKDVFVEKPMCLTYDQVYEMVQLSKESNRKLYVDHIYTFCPEINYIKDIIKNDILLEYQAYRYNGQCSTFDSSIIGNLMYHDLYIYDYLFNVDNLSNINIEHKKFESCFLRSNKVKIVSKYNTNKKRVIRIKTDNNHIIWDELSGELLINKENVYINKVCDNINYMFNRLNKDDISKNVSLKITKFIEDLDERV